MHDCTISPNVGDPVRATARTVAGSQNRHAGVGAATWPRLLKAHNHARRHVEITCARCSLNAEDSALKTSEIRKFAKSGGERATARETEGCLH
eukprot:5914123-Pleurochrysis_carterae.AAC.1